MSQFKQYQNFKILGFYLHRLCNWEINLKTFDSEDTYIATKIT
jgi:uncharacterized protein YozE (UPF0346 family)